jgi:hypothetical protein
MESLSRINRDEWRWMDARDWEGKWNRRLVQVTLGPPSVMVASDADIKRPAQACTCDGPDLSDNLMTDHCLCGEARSGQVRFKAQKLDLCLLQVAI